MARVSRPSFSTTHIQGLTLPEEPFLYIHKL